MRKRLPVTAVGMPVIEATADALWYAIVPPLRRRSSKDFSAGERALWLALQVAVGDAVEDYLETPVRGAVEAATVVRLVSWGVR